MNSNPLLSLFPGGLSLSTIAGIAGIVGIIIQHQTGDPFWSGLGAMVSAVLLPEEPKK